MIMGKKILSWDRYLLQWGGSCDALTVVMQKLNPSGEWYIEVANFGWRGVPGKKTFHADTGEELLGLFNPNCSLDIYRRGKMLAIDNKRHHDLSIGEKWYYIKPLERATLATPVHPRPHIIV